MELSRSPMWTFFQFSTLFQLTIWVRQIDEMLGLDASINVLLVLSIIRSEWRIFSISSIVSFYSNSIEIKYRTYSRVHCKACVCEPCDTDMRASTWLRICTRAGLFLYSKIYINSSARTDVRVCHSRMRARACSALIFLLQSSFGAFAYAMCAPAAKILGMQKRNRNKSGVARLGWDTLMLIPFARKKRAREAARRRG